MDRLGYKGRVCTFVGVLDEFVSVLNRFPNAIYITRTLRALAGVIFRVMEANAPQGRKSAQSRLCSYGKLMKQMCACATRMKIVEALTTSLTKTGNDVEIEGVGLQT